MWAGTCVCVTRAGEPFSDGRMDRKSKTFFFFNLEVANAMDLLLVISCLVCGVIRFHSEKSMPPGA